MLYLIFPASEHKQAVWDYRQEYFDFGETHIHGSAGISRSDDYESWLAKIIEAQTVVQPGLVTGSIYFAFAEDKIIGTIAVRHALNDSLINSGGHIGYSVRPSERRKGYGTKMLALALEKARGLGLDKVLITCDKDNIASAKTAVKNGGIMENEIAEETGNILQRYWITL